jgi:tRNA (uracil-5-)-methyltransferase
MLGYLLQAQAEGAGVGAGVGVGAGGFRLKSLYIEYDGEGEGGEDRGKGSGREGVEGGDTGSAEANGGNNSNEKMRGRQLWGTKWVYGETHLLEDLGGLTFRISPPAFFQVNTKAAELLYAEVARWLLVGEIPGAYSDGGGSNGGGSSSGSMDYARDADKESPPRGPLVVLDVCCGTGTIGLCVAEEHRRRQQQQQHSSSQFYSTPESVRIIGVELCKPAVLDAQANAVLNSLQEWTHYVAGKAEAVLAALPDFLLQQGVLGAQPETQSSPATLQSFARLPSPSTNVLPDVVAVIDPPRTGMHPSVAVGLRMAPAVKRVVFISCNPTGKYVRWDYLVKGGSLLENAMLLCAPTLPAKFVNGSGTAGSADAESSGRPFRLAAACAVDLFPDTPHWEMVCVFERL